MTELQEILNKQVDTKVKELSHWKKVQWEGGRLYFETCKIHDEIEDYSLESQLYYLEELYKRNFIVQDNLPSSAPDITEDLKNWLNSQISKLKIKHIEKDFEIDKKTPTKSLNSNNIFIVHGHNSEIKIDVARTIEKLGLNPIILQEQPNSGKTIIEKFETYADVGFAIILITDDDIGKSKLEDAYNYRARQNVILELGYFIAKLGREKVCSLYTKGVELPNDIHGLLYIEIDKNETWKMKLVKELKSAGYKVDADRII